MTAHRWHLTALCLVPVLNSCCDSCRCSPTCPGAPAYQSSWQAGRSLSSWRASFSQWYFLVGKSPRFNCPCMEKEAKTVHELPKYLLEGLWPRFFFLPWAIKKGFSFLAQVYGPLIMTANFQLLQRAWIGIFSSSVVGFFRYIFGLSSNISKREKKRKR